MSRALSLGTLLLAGPLLGISCAQNSWAQNKIELPQTAPAFPFTKTIFRWDYSCPAAITCTVVCPGGEVNHVLKLSLYLGTVLFDNSQSAPAVFYEMNTREYPHASGFSISPGPPGLTNLSCRVNGMTLNYSGPPK